MPDPRLVSRAQRAATMLERAWERWRATQGLEAEPMPPVSSYVGYSIEEPWGRPRVVFGVNAEDAERLAALLQQSAGYAAESLPGPADPGYRPPARGGFAADRPAGPDHGYQDHGYPDRGYQDRGYPDRGYDQSLLDDVRGRIPVQGWPPEFSESREQLNGAGPSEPELPLDLGPAPDDGAAGVPRWRPGEPDRPHDLKLPGELGLSDEFRGPDDFPGAEELPLGDEHAGDDDRGPFGVDAPYGVPYAGGAPYAVPFTGEPYDPDGPYGPYGPASPYEAPGQHGTPGDNRSSGTPLPGSTRPGTSPRTPPRTRPTVLPGPASQSVTVPQLAPKSTPAGGLTGTCGMTTCGTRTSWMSTWGTSPAAMSPAGAKTCGTSPGANSPGAMMTCETGRTGAGMCGPVGTSLTATVARVSTCWPVRRRRSGTPLVTTPVVRMC